MHGLADLLECGFVHVVEKFVLLDELVLQDQQLGVNLAILVLQSVDLHFGVHVLLI